MEEDETICATVDCGEYTARYGCYCGQCLNLRRENYSQLVSGDWEIRVTINPRSGNKVREIVKPEAS